MPDVVPALNTHLVYLKIFQQQERPTLKINWLRKTTWCSQHPCHVHFASGQKGGLKSTPLKSLTKVGEDNILLLNKEEPEKALLILQCVYLDTKCRWQHKNSANCIGQM